MEVDRTERIDGSPGGGTPTQDSNHGDVDMRLSTTSQSIQSVVAVASSVPNSQPGFQTKRRCRDFDGLYFLNCFIKKFNNKTLNCFIKNLIIKHN